VVPGDAVQPGGLGEAGNEGGAGRGKGRGGGGAGGPRGEGEEKARRGALLPPWMLCARASCSSSPQQPLCRACRCAGTPFLAKEKMGGSAGHLCNTGEETGRPPFSWEIQSLQWCACAMLVLTRLGYGVPVVYLWCTCGGPVLYLLCTCGVRVLYPWCPQGSLHLSVTSSAAAAVVSLSSVPGGPGLPGKLNPVIQPLMGGIKERVSSSWRG